MNSRALNVVISSLLIFSILIVMTLSTYIWGLSYLSKYKDVATFEGVKGDMKVLKASIDMVSHEGKGSRNFIKIHIPEGRLKVNASNDYIVYIMESDAEIVQAGSSVEQQGLELQGEISPRGKYTTKIIVNYSGTMINIVGNSSAPKGYYTIKINNIGYNTTTDKIKVQVGF